MTALQVAAIVAGIIAGGCLGIALGCKVGGDDRNRHEVGVLALAFACFCGVAALVFYGIGTQV